MILGQGTMINSYRLLTPIGSGGMGEVYLAEEAILGRKVAIKVLNPILTREEHFKQRFINEARIQASLQHPNIVGLYSFFEQDENFYMALEYAEGKTLKDIIAETGPMPEPRVEKILQQILGALQYAHGKGTIHRDIKPSNIMVDDKDNVKIMDFGIARIMGDNHLTKTGLKVGTLYYMSPEQIVTPKEVDFRTDIYSTGIVLYEMLTGRLPFNTNTESDFVIQKEIVDNKLPDPKSIYPHISEYLTRLMYLMASKDATKRPNIHDIFSNLSGQNNHNKQSAAFYPVTKHSNVQTTGTQSKKTIPPTKASTPVPSKFNNHSFDSGSFDYMAAAIISSLMCLPLGLAALSETFVARRLIKEGDNSQAKNHFRAAMVLSISGIILGLILLGGLLYGWWS